MPVPPPGRSRVIQFWTNAPADLISTEEILERRFFYRRNDFKLLRLECVMGDKAQQNPDVAIVTAQHFAVNKWCVRFHNEFGWYNGIFPMLGFELHPATGRVVMFDFLPGQFCWGTDMTFAGCDYHIFIHLPEPAFEPQSEGGERKRDRIRALSVSAESFRRTCHSVADELEQVMRKRFAPAIATMGFSNDPSRGGSIIQERRPQKLQDTSHGKNPSASPQLISHTPSRPLTREDWQAVLDAGLAEIAKRRQIIDQHHQEMFKAFSGLLPVHELMEPLKSESADARKKTSLAPEGKP